MGRRKGGKNSKPRARPRGERVVGRGALAPSPDRVAAVVAATTGSLAQIAARPAPHTYDAALEAWRAPRCTCEVYETCAVCRGER